jgi:hypothetical protein
VGFRKAIPPCPRQEAIAEGPVRSLGEITTLDHAQNAANKRKFVPDNAYSKYKDASDVVFSANEHNQDQLEIRQAQHLSVHVRDRKAEEKEGIGSCREDLDRSHR